MVQSTRIKDLFKIYPDFAKDERNRKKKHEEDFENWLTSFAIKTNEGKYTFDNCLYNNEYSKEECMILYNI